MAKLEEVRIDVRDVDFTWFEDVAAYLDRDSDRYYLPRESAERLGEPDEETGGFWLIDGHVEALADEIEINGRLVQVWEVGITQLLTRPAKVRS